MEEYLSECTSRTKDKTDESEISGKVCRKRNSFEIGAATFADGLVLSGLYAWGKTETGDV